MKTWYDHINHIVKAFREDLEYLLFVGLPGGIIFILLYKWADYSKLF